MGGTCGKVTMHMVECGTWIMLWFNELIFSMHWLINGVNGARWHVLWSKCDIGGRQHAFTARHLYPSHWPPP
jgi:hypothetical protein